MSACRKCGDDINWVQQDGRWRCYNAGTEIDHWDSCSRRRWEQTVATGERFVEKHRSGYRKSVHGTKIDRMTSGVIRGENYKPVTHQPGCTAAPWEDCNCG